MESVVQSFAEKNVKRSKISHSSVFTENITYNKYWLVLKWLFEAGQLKSANTPC